MTIFQFASTSRLNKLCLQQLLMLADDSWITYSDTDLSYKHSKVCFAFAPHSDSITTTTTTINIFVIIVIISSIIIVNSLRKRRHFATPLLVSLRNDVSGTSAEIPYWWRVTSQIWVVLLIGRAAREICFSQSEALPRSGTWHVISMECLRLFLRRHFAGKPVSH